MNKAIRIMNQTSWIALASMVILGSCKDEFTDEDLINKTNELGKDSIQLSIIAYNASASLTASQNGRTVSAKGTENLAVTLNVNGSLITQNTDSHGLAVFPGMQPGTVAGVISGTGFTTVNFSVSVEEPENPNGGNEPVTYAGVVIPVFENSGPNAAVVTGRVTVETDLLNNTRENVPDGTRITFAIDTESDNFQTLMSSLADLSQDLAGNTSLERISFESNFVATVLSGSYSIELPVSTNGLAYTFLFSEFNANQRIAINHFQNTPDGSVRDVQMIMTTFKQVTGLPNNDRTIIPSVSSTQFDIGLPPLSGTGASALVRLLPAPLAASYTVLASGSGYSPSATTIPVTINGGDFDDTVPGAVPADITASSDASGRITGIVINNADFGYRSQATLTIGGSGSGAVVRVNYQSQLAPLFGTGVNSGTTLTSGGSGYFAAPTVVFQGFDINNNQLEATSGSTIFNGSVINFAVPSPVVNWSRTPTVTFVAPERRPAIVGFYSVNTLGALTSVPLSAMGNGYDLLNPPAVTIRDLRGLGSGALVRALMNTNGTLEPSLSILAQGLGYSASNANFPASREGFQFDTDNFSEYEPTTMSLFLKPGTTNVLNAHYGTGIRSTGVE